MTDLDTILRDRAHAALAGEAARVDVDAELAAFDALLPTARGTTSPAGPADEPHAVELVAVTTAADHGAGRRARRRPVWLAAAAAAVLVVGGIAVAVRRGDDSVVTAPSTTGQTRPDTSTVTTLDGSEPTTAAPTTVTPAADDSLATAAPSVVAPGDVVTLTPAGPVERTCNDIVHVQRLGEGAAVAAGLLVDADGTLDDSPASTLPACLGETTDAPLTRVVPSELTAGEYRLCLAGIDEPAGCALVTVVDDAGAPTDVPTATVPDAAPTSTSGTDAAGPLVAPVAYLGRTDDGDPTTGAVVIHDVAFDGTLTGTRSELEYRDAVQWPVAVTSSSSIGLGADSRDQGRCTSYRYGAMSVGDEPPSIDVNALGDVRGIAGSGTGYVVVGRDVCPDGTRWGDDGTYHEVVRHHLTDASDPPLVLVQRAADPTAIVFDDGGDVVVAPDELTPVTVDPSGRYVGVAESTSIETTRFHVLDAEAAAGGTPDGLGAAVELGSACAQPGDLVGPPRFVDAADLGGAVVVVARRCPGTGPTGLVVEAVRLSDRALVWSLAVEAVSVDDYTSRVGNLSATVVDGGLWVIVSGSAGVEQPYRSALLHGGRQAEITQSSLRDVAFTLDDLIGDNETHLVLGG